MATAHTNTVFQTSFGLPRSSWPSPFNVGAFLNIINLHHGTIFPCFLVDNKTWLWSRMGSLSSFHPLTRSLDHNVLHLLSLPPWITVFHQFFFYFLYAIPVVKPFYYFTWNSKCLLHHTTTLCTNNTRNEQVSEHIFRQKSIINQLQLKNYSVIWLKYLDKMTVMST
jgi:hypothetical protein